MNLPRFAPAALAAAVLLRSSGARAESTGAVAEPLPSVAVTISPLHLILPVVELTIEPRLTDHLSVAVIGGYGSIKVESGLESYRFRVLEAGGQLRYYVLGNYRQGMQVGAELLYIRVNTDDSAVGTVKVSGAGEGLVAGPFVGYKIATQVGFTFDAQLGAQYGLTRARATDGESSASGSESRLFPLLNLNIGWSF